MALFDLIIGPPGGMTVVPVLARSPAEVFQLGREMYPGQPLAVVRRDQD